MILSHEYFKAFMFPQIGHNWNNYINFSSEQMDTYTFISYLQRNIIHTYEFENIFPKQFENSSHTRNLISELFKIGPYFDCNYIFPIDLAPNENQLKSCS